MTWTSFVSDDEHAGGLVGLMLGAFFVAIGCCIRFIPEGRQDIPGWRRATGIFVILLGIFAILTGFAFLLLGEDEL